MTRLASECKIFESSYQLVPKSTIGSVATQQPRKGALLRFEFAENRVGYSDCFPWPELGDQPLGVQLEQLKKGELTALTQRSLEYARMDSEARARGVSLWDGLAVPPSHALITNLNRISTSGLMALVAQGFTHVKIKLGLRGLEDARYLTGFSDVFKLLGLKIRLDFNCSLSADEVNRFLKELEPIRTMIDLIEDPCPYEPSAWSSIQSRWRVRLALDRFPMDLAGKKEIRLTPGSFSVLILKPAIQNPDKILLLADQLGASVVVTSYLDHPLGQLEAAWTASSLAWRYPKRIETCGLLSHVAYEDHSFSKYLNSHGPSLFPPTGAGFGMGEPLGEQDWRPI